MEASAIDPTLAAIERFLEAPNTDGLPVVPPTPDKVEAFLATVGLDPEEILGAVPTREVTVTAEHAAINAVMRGGAYPAFTEREPDGMVATDQRWSAAYTTMAALVREELVELVPERHPTDDDAVDLADEQVLANQSVDRAP